MKLTNLHLEPNDYRIYYVNIDLRHQYGISAAESQTFLRAKRLLRRRARRNGCFRRLPFTFRKIFVNDNNPCSNGSRVDLTGLKVEESHQSSNLKSLLKQPGPG